jgi:hypothetical protein
MKKNTHKEKPQIKIHWSGFRPLYDFWGNELKRFYQLETLAHAVNGVLEQGGKFITASAQAVLGLTPITSFHFELFQEGRYQLIFRLHTSAGKGRNAVFAFVAAKNHLECSAVARAEHGHLQTLYRRMPEYVVKPYRGGTVYLPDRHRRKEMGRPIYAYLTEWLHGYEELGIAENHQFIINREKRHLFSVAETELLKSMIVTIVARSYDPKTHTMMTIPEIASGDFVVHYKPRAPLRLKLIACRKMLSRVTPGQAVANMLKTAGTWAGKPFRMAPQEPAQFLAGLTAALGEERAAVWIQQYLEGAAAGRFPKHDSAYLEALRRLVLK